MLRLASSKAAQWVASSAPHSSKATRTLSAKTKFDLPDPACELSSRQPLPLSKMVSTIGPTSEQIEPLTKIVKQGMNVMRLNFSHATTEEVELRLTNLEQAEKALSNRQAPEVQQIRALLLDTRGPEIRTGKLKNDHSGKETVPLEKGETITLHTSATVQEEGSTSSDLFIDYPMLHKALHPGMKVLLDDGAVILTVVEVESDKEFYGTVTCTIDNSGEIRSRAGVNLPMAETELPALSEKDKADIKYGMSKDIDYVAASFVQTGEGVRDIRRYIKECAEELGFAPHDPLPHIISKIESASALIHFDEILEESDGIMVARGDLGVEIPLQQVTNAQKEMVTACNIVGKPVIVATQMLESMAKNPRPTRAEVADVSNAVYDGADAVMTSGETAKGKYPVETVKMMKEIIIGAEGYSQSGSLGSPRTKTQRTFEGPQNSPEAAIARGAVAASIEQKSAAIVVLSDKHELPQLVSACRPEVPVFAFCATSKMARLLMLRRAIHPIVGLNDVESEKKAESAIEILKNMDLLHSGESAVLVSSDDETLGHTDTLKIVTVP